MKNERKLILKLGQKITDRFWHKVTVDDPEYWGLDSICTDEMAEVALKMKVRIPYRTEQLAPKCGKTVEKTTELLDALGQAGIVEWGYDKKNGHRHYILPIFVPGSGELFAANWEAVAKNPIPAMAFDELALKPLALPSQFVPVGNASLGMRVIPVEKAIPAGTKSESFEHISHWLKQYDTFAAIDCVCRNTRKLKGEGCGHTAEEMCIIVGDLATWCVETGRARRYHTYEEVIEILQRAEDLGFVHQINQCDGPGKIFVICNCCYCSCFALRSSQYYNTPNMSRSNYIAKVESENCVACGRCVEFCPSNAAKLGQKLCNKSGAIEYPRRELPDNALWWGKDKWNPDYRDRRDNCYDTGTSPCKTNCPAHVSVQGYIKKAAEGKYMEALALIKQENPFPAVCGRICNRRCEDACTRGSLDNPVAIVDIKNFIAEQELKVENRYIPNIVYDTMEPHKEKIAVIGAGPAGMSCAFFLAQKGFPVTVFDKNSKPGGMLLSGIPSYRLEKDVIEAEIDVLRRLGIEFKCGVEVGKDITLDSLRAEGYKALYVAIGCQGGRLIGVPGEDAKGVITGVEFLNQINSEKGAKLTGKTVVIGGGNVAIDVARSAVRAGASEVSMYCLEGRDIMPAAKDEIEEAQAEGISLNNSWGPKEILVEGGKVKGIVFMKCVSVFDAEKRFNPKYNENDTITVECENVLLSVGQSIQWGDLLKGSKVELGRGNCAVADPATYQTAQPDIFVGGDVYTGPKFAIDAIAAGKEGAVSISRFVLEGHSLTIGRNKRKYIELDKENVQIPISYDNSARQVPAKVDHAKSKGTFSDLRSVFTEEQLKQETARCLGCGASVVDPNACLGCGVCTTKCEFDAIHLERVFDGKMIPWERIALGMASGVAQRGINIVRYSVNKVADKLTNQIPD